jgi:hypothetical protein
MDDLIQVVQLPVIEQRLRSIKSVVESRVKEATSLACTPDNISDIRKARSELSKEFALYDEQRKAVKEQIMRPYESFNMVFKECVTDLYKKADSELKSKIEESEMSIKSQCEDGLRDYFKELCEAEGVQWLSYDRAGIVVDMTSAKQKVPKKLREKITQFVTGVSRSVSLIADMENAEEIMVEFKRTLDATESIAIVQERHRMVEAEKEGLSGSYHPKNVQEQSTAPTISDVTPPKDDFLSSPKVIQPTEDAETQVEDMVYVSFKVTGSIQKINELKQFLVNGGYEYEQLGE